MQHEAINTFGIGAVVQRTGLSAPNIRIWEKRYGAVEPCRTESNRRLYTEEDIQRLTLLKQLTDNGHAIGHIANLALDQLQLRLDQDGPTAGPSPRTPSKRAQLLVVGPGPAELVRNESILEVTLAAELPDLESATKSKELPDVDLVVIEIETLFPETISAVRELVQRTGSPRSILIYGFTNSDTATALARTVEGLSLFKAPLDDRQLRRECLVQLSELRPDELPVEVDTSEPIPERLYDLPQLSQLSRISSTVECECPKHLASLLQSLCAFEKYSRECEDRNPEDALLHTFLHRTTAGVRRTMEEALRHVVVAEGIKVAE